MQLGFILFEHTQGSVAWQLCRLGVGVFRRVVRIGTRRAQKNHGEPMGHRFAAAAFSSSPPQPLVLCIVVLCFLLEEFQDESGLLVGQA